MVCGQGNTNETWKTSTERDKATYGGLTDMLVVTTTVRVVNGVLKARMISISKIVEV
jgi:hypothetical protein